MVEDEQAFDLLDSEDVVKHLVELHSLSTCLSKRTENLAVLASPSHLSWTEKIK